MSASPPVDPQTRALQRFVELLDGQTEPLHPLSWQTELAGAKAALVRSAAAQQDTPQPQCLIDAINLCESEANRWKGDKTGEHWQRVGKELRDLYVGLALDEAVRRTKPLVDKELEAERIPQGLMEFRMRAAAAPREEPAPPQITDPGEAAGIMRGLADAKAGRDEC